MMITKKVRKRTRALGYQYPSKRERLILTCPNGDANKQHMEFLIGTNKFESVKETENSFILVTHDCDVPTGKHAFRRFLCDFGLFAVKLIDRMAPRN